MKLKLTVTDANKTEDCILFLRLKRLIAESEVERIRHRLAIALAWQNVDVRKRKTPRSP